jgi:hypothetical protein
MRCQTTSPCMRVRIPASDPELPHFWCTCLRVTFSPPKISQHFLPTTTDGQAVQYMHPTRSHPHVDMSLGPLCRSHVSATTTILGHNNVLGPVLA